MQNRIFVLPGHKSGEKNLRSYHVKRQPTQGFSIQHGQDARVLVWGILSGW